MARSEYYDQAIRGTPTTIFNGEPLAGGGGGMANAEAKYQQYREIIDERLEKTPQATIDLKATRDGKNIKINASAKAEKAAEGSKPKLRLVVIEEAVRYVGGNGLRFHHHVVRDMPGGPEGKELADGQVEVEQTVSLDDVTNEIQTYLSDFEKNRSAFPNPLPPIKLENLSIVAFVQDDADKSVWSAVQVPLEENGK